jgi:hypothetical protein
MFLLNAPRPTDLANYRSSFNDTRIVRIVHPTRAACNILTPPPHFFDMHNVRDCGGLSNHTTEGLVDEHLFRRDISHSSTDVLEIADKAVASRSTENAPASTAKVLMAYADEVLVIRQPKKLLVDRHPTSLVDHFTSNPSDHTCRVSGNPSGARR